ncbi:MAG TPA: carboxypeptidase-like regulatory domain-containing protein [Flavisolibacter sp.]|nr:carboxypeptidase-like regulatory domain-containing protein [Flavisolibacter sp.]
MKKPIFFLALTFCSLLGFAQVTLTGKVVDAESKEPLASASVFAQNTTKGTTTDKDGQFTLYLDKGGYELIVSFTGYTSKTISMQGAESQSLTIELSKADNSMSEVVIKSSNEVPDGWEKYGQFFIRYFIGATPFADSCSLQNPGALKFFYYKRNDRLKVLATEPLVISNRSLGYNLRYELDSFVYFFKTGINSYRGLCLYTEMEGSDDEKQAWIRNRALAYEGSRLHFLRSYYDSTLSQEGFTVDVLSKTRANKFNRLTNPYDTSYYYYNDSTFEAELWFPVKASISYNKKAPEKEYLEQFKLPLNVPIQISYIDLLDAIIIKPNGYFFSQQSWVSQGYWSWKNIADQLPYDYEKG